MDGFKQILEEGPHRPEGMANDRADDFVLAGSAPRGRSLNDPIEHVHRGTSFILLVDSLIVVYFVAQVLGMLGLLNTTTGSVILGVVSVGALMVYLNYRQRAPGAYWLAAIVLIFASAVFALNLFFSAFILLSSTNGSISSLIFVVLFGWAALGSGRRALFHWHPGYRAGYMNRNPAADIDLEEGEMLAACPSCLAVLAIRPLMLNRHDRCPHCSALLVSEALYAKHSDGEE